MTVGLATPRTCALCGLGPCQIDAGDITKGSSTPTSCRDSRPALGTCVWCKEAVSTDDGGFANGLGQTWHRECIFRQVSGGVNHLIGLCTCCGGDLPPDPEGVPLRQAARMALAAYQAGARARTSMEHSDE